MPLPMTMPPSKLPYRHWVDEVPRSYVLSVPGLMLLPTMRVDEMVVGPEMETFPAKEDEAEEMKPPVRVERLLTRSVLDAFNAPATCNPALMLDDAAEIKPPVKVERPESVALEFTVRTPETWRPAVTVDDAEEINPLVRVARSETPSVEAKLAAPPARSVPDAERAPAICSPPPTLEEAFEENPAVNVPSPYSVVVPAESVLVVIVMLPNPAPREPDASPPTVLIVFCPV